ncbi:MAG: MATE family efflux transporter [Lachnospiraceae bacterium]|nr:MATE family efflux transporter [Lachnospiraceae bacterium]
MKLLSNNKRAEVDLLQGVIWKKILVFSLPILLGAVFQQMYSLVDAIVLGRAVSADALAAVGATTTVSTLLNSLFVAISGGASVVIAQWFGAGDEKRVEKAVHTAIAASLVGGVILTLVGILLARPVLAMTRVPEEILNDSVTYMQVYFIGATASLLYNTGTGVLRAIGNSRTPLFILIITSIMNVILDLIFVLGLRLGVFGVAVATVMSQIISAVLVMAILMKTKASYRYEIRKTAIDWSNLKEMVRIGFPSCMESLCYSGTNLIAQTVINGFHTAAIAAWAAVLRVDGIMYMIQMSYAVSVSTMVGQNFGARQYDRVKKIVRTGIFMNLGTISAAVLVICLYCPQIIGIFNGDSAVIEAGTTLLFTLALANLTNVFSNLLPKSIRACGESLRPMILTVSCVCGLRLGVLLGLVPRFHTLFTVSLSWPISWGITGLIFIIYYRRGNWLKRCIARQEEKTEADT